MSAWSLRVAGGRCNGDNGDFNGKGRGTLRKVWFVGLLVISVTILIGVATKEKDETMMEWGSDVAEMLLFFSPSFVPNACASPTNSRLM